MTQRKIIFIRGTGLVGSPLLKSHVEGYTRKDGTPVKPHDDKRTKKAAESTAYSHPHAVGKAELSDPYAEGAHDASAMKFAGTHYNSTGKAGKSFHDETPVREFEADDGHRVWMDHHSRVHADDVSEVPKLRAKFEAHSGEHADDKDEGASGGDKEDLDREMNDSADADHGAKEGYDKSKSSEPYNLAQIKLIAETVSKLSGTGVDKVQAVIQTLIDSPAFAAAKDDGEGLAGGPTKGSAARKSAEASGDKAKQLSLMSVGLSKTFAHPKFPAEKVSVKRDEKGFTITPPSAFGGKPIGPLNSKEAAAKLDEMFSENTASGKAKAAAKPKAPTGPIATKNEGQGFHGTQLQRLTANKHGEDTSHYDLPEKDQIDIKGRADAQFDKAAKKLVALGHFDDHDHAVDFLDSRMGRHLGDEADGADSIDKVKWLPKAVAEYKKDPSLPFGGSKKGSGMMKSFRDGLSLLIFGGRSDA